VGASEANFHRTEFCSSKVQAHNQAEKVTFHFTYLQSKIQHSTLKTLTSTYPGLTQEMLDYEIQVIREFVKNNP